MYININITGCFLDDMKSFAGLSLICYMSGLETTSENPSGPNILEFCDATKGCS